MSELEKRETLKRERLNKLRVARTKETLFGYLLIPVVFLTAVGIVGAIYGVWRFLRVGAVNGVIVSVIGIVVGLLFARLTILCCRNLTTLKHQVERLSYVPRSETAPLPAEEVLLRGSSRSAGQSDNRLLRATTPQSMPASELLRMPDADTES